MTCKELIRRCSWCEPPTKEDATDYICHRCLRKSFPEEYKSIRRKLRGGEFNGVKNENM